MGTEYLGKLGGKRRRGITRDSSDQVWSKGKRRRERDVSGELKLGSPTIWGRERELHERRNRERRKRGKESEGKNREREGTGSL